jgi:hypothetical protein
MDDLKLEETSDGMPEDGRTQAWAQLRTAGKEETTKICMEHVLGRVRCACNGSRRLTRKVKPFAK